MANEKLIFEIGFDLDGAVQVAIKDGKKAITKIQKELGKTPIQLDVDTKSLRAELKKLNDAWNKLSASQRAGVEGTKLREQYRALTLEANGYTSTLRSAVSAEDKATAAKQRATKATERQNAAYKTQSSYLSRLVQRMIAYASVAQAFSFIRNIREVTAEFELQRVALGSIIGDLNEANAMFEQIKAAAVKSPFQIKELVTYTKQLAAYKIETDELFETTQRLADISAGLGVGMERLVLAYGQIRATGYLRASEVRQLNEAGIPIVEELAKKMSELRGETVSAAEVMGMISERAISFGMVKEVFDDMTSAGGMFYKMQEKQAETLAGQWNNLKDSIAIMYEEIGNTSIVSNGMQIVISLLKSMIENWRVWGGLIDATLGTIALYAIAMKNASIASKALTIEEAKRNVVTSMQLNRAPKVIAMIIGENNAKKLSILFSKQLYKARLAEATATGLLTKAWAKLRIAMLSNPYTAILASIGAIIGAFITFRKGAETTEERIQSLNSSIASLTNHKDNVGKLIDEFDELSQKANKTAQEQARLNQVTRELASIYPSAISGARKYGDELDVNIDKVKELYEAEKELREEKVRQELATNEAERAELKRQYDALVSTIKKGTQTIIIPQLFGDDETGEIELTEEQLNEMRDQALEIADKMHSLDTSIRDAKIALGELDEEGETIVDTFNAWQKELAAINEGTNDLGDAIRVFDDESISQINKLTDATARVAEAYNRFAKEKERVDKALLSEGAKADAEVYEQLEGRLGRINSAMSLLYDFLKKYDALDLIAEGDTTPEKNPRITLLNEELSTVEKIYKEYQELRKFMRDDDARARIADMFEGVNLTMLSQALSPTEMRAQLQKALDEAKKMGDEAQILEFEYRLGKFDADEAQRQLEESMRDLSDKISRTKTAKEFFDRMLGMTGDKQLSATLTLSVYGTTGDDLQRLMSKQVEDAFKNLPEGFDITKAMLGGGKFDYNLLESWIEKLPEQDRKSAQSIVDNWRKTNRDIITDLYKTYEEFLSFEERKTKVVEKENAERMRIINSGLPMAEQERLVAASQKRENKALADIAIEEFKASEDWAKSFEDLENLATPTIERLMAKLKEFIDTQEDLTPEQLRTLTNEYKKLYDGLIARNPFKAMTDGIKEYVAATKDVKTAKDRVATAQEELRIATDRKAAAEQNFKTSQDVVTAGREYASAIKEYNEASQNAANADKDLGDALDAQKTALNKTVQSFNAASSAISNFGSIITDITEILGIAEDSEVGAFIKDLVKWLGVMAGVLSTVAAIIAVIESELAPLLGIAAGIAAIGAAISFFANAKVRKANKEIERQQELLDQLAYSYDRLEKAQEKAFGTDYIQNYQRQLENLQAQYEAYLKQTELERSKGKKADEEKIKEYEAQARDTADAIKDMQSELSEHFLGTDLTSAARDFANAWIDAYKEFGSTTDAMKAKFQDMIQNMIVESFAARVIQSALSDIFTEIDNMTKDGIFDMSEATKVTNMTNQAIDNIDVGMTNLMNALEQAGISVRGMGSNLTGISRDIATASEESILGLAAGINTQNFYISQVPTKLDTIIGLLRGENAMQGSTITLQDLVTMQNQHLSHLPSIAQHTAETVAECKQIVVETRRTANALERVIKPRGTQSSYTINATLN